MRLVRFSSACLRRGTPEQALNVVNRLLRYRSMERPNAAAPGRVFRYSTNLSNWNRITPDSNTVVVNSSSVVTREATFPVMTISGFYRSSY